MCVVYILQPLASASKLCKHDERGHLSALVPPPHAQYECVCALSLRDREWRVVFTVSQILAKQLMTKHNKNYIDCTDKGHPD